MKIALLLLGVNEKCGGAERFFADFFTLYKGWGEKKHQLFFFTDAPSLRALKTLGKLHDNTNVIALHERHNRFKNILETAEFGFSLLSKKIGILHIVSYGRHYLPRIRFINSLPRWLRPYIIVNIVDCEIPYAYGSAAHPKHKQYLEKYSPLFNEINIDGVYSWYKLFKEFAVEKNIMKGRPRISYINSRFADVSRFQPAREKKNKIVWAARMVAQKRPVMFVEAVSHLRRISGEMVNWTVEMYGEGEQEIKVKQAIMNEGLSEIIKVFPTTPLEKVFSESACFVSTQEYENFPSQSMNEAMAAGNAIIARNVGQTDYFVKDGINGILVNGDSPESLAAAMKYYIEHPELHESMQNESIRLTKEVHTPGNFIREIDKFWNYFS